MYVCMGSMALTMPHLVLDHSANIALPDDLPSLLLSLHRILADTGGIHIGNCKSRVYRADSWLIAEGDQPEGFVHLNIRFVAGRSTETRRQISRQCLAQLEAALLPINETPLQITVNAAMSKTLRLRLFRTQFIESTFSL